MDFDEQMPIEKIAEEITVIRSLVHAYINTVLTDEEKEKFIKMLNLVNTPPETDVS